MLAIATLVGIVIAGASWGRTVEANTARITASEKDIVWAIATLEAWTDDIDELKQMLREIASEMRGYHAPR